MGVAAALTRGRIFPDVDRAIEWAEEHLILSRLGDVESGTEFPFARIEIFALLDREARSATVEADEELVCYVLTRADFDKLTAEHPAVAIKLLTNLGRE